MSSHRHINRVNQNARRHGKSSTLRRLAAILEKNAASHVVEPISTLPPPPPPYSMKQFASCKPAKYSGGNGATALLQWFESMENTFMISECPDHLRVRYASSVFTKRALTWWNGQKIILGLEETYEQSWADFKSLMLEEFCPENEIAKLEEEFHGLKQQSGDHSAYTTRFHELSLLVPHQITPESRAIKKYIKGLPLEVQTHVLATQPTTLASAIRLAASLTDTYVTAGTLTVTKPKKKTNKTKRTKETTTDHKPESTKCKKTNTTQSYAITQPFSNQPQPQFTTPQPYKRAYTGPYPQCLSCHYHHPSTMPCRLCNSCNRLGHFAEYCRIKPIASTATPPTNRGCYICGDPNHFMRICPHKQVTAPTAPTLQIDRGRILAITNGEDQAQGEQ